MFTCSSGVSFLRNFPKYRVHFAAALSHSLSFVYISDVLLISLSLLVLVNTSISLPPLFSFAWWWWCCCRFCVCFLLCVLVWSRGVVLHGLRKNLTNFKCVVFLPSSKIVCIFACFFFVGVCLKTQNATPKCTQPNPSAPKGSLILLHALDLLFVYTKQTASKCQSLTVHRYWSVLPTLTAKILLEKISISEPIPTEVGENQKKSLEISHIDRGGVVQKVNIHSALFTSFVWFV